MFTSHTQDFGFPSRLEATYILPIAASAPQVRALSGYLRRLSRTMAEVIVVDGSPEDVFAAHNRAWRDDVRHIRPRFQTANGKVAGVLTGIVEAGHNRVILADDDVRYRRAELERMIDLLDRHDVVRPQNRFSPMPWHARWDTARSLYNRLAGGDWPGTLGVSREALLATGGYSGEVLFENLEMVRTIQAAGGREAVPLDLFVARRPPSARHFASQRIRQAYDELARPARLAAQLAILPIAVQLARKKGPASLLALAATAVVLAEVGRRKDKGATVFPGTSALWGPAWLAERAVTSWIALGTRLLHGGVRYRSGRPKVAATPLQALRQQSAADRPIVAQSRDHPVSTQ
jgi:glycosyltransferase involved in cell wall biosynthesis